MRRRTREKIEREAATAATDQILRKTPEQILIALNNPTTNQLVRESIAASARPPRQAIDMIIRSGDAPLQFLILAHPSISETDYGVLARDQKTAAEHLVMNFRSWSDAIWLMTCLRFLESVH